MNQQLKKLIITGVLLFSAESFARVGGFCINSVPGTLNQNSEYSYYTEGNMALMGVGVCKSLSGVRTGLKVVSLGLSAGGLVAACGVVTVPFAAGIEITAGIMNLITGSIEIACTDSKDQTTPEQVQNYLCSQLKAQGLACDPNLQIQLN
jgi:hypothetical protein